MDQKDVFFLRQLCNLRASVRDIGVRAAVHALGVAGFFQYVTIPCLCSHTKDFFLVFGIYLHRVPALILKIPCNMHLYLCAEIPIDFLCPNSMMLRELALKLEMCVLGLHLCE